MTLANVAVLTPTWEAAEQDLKRCYRVAAEAGLAPKANLEWLILDIPESARFQWVSAEADLEVIRDYARFTEWRPIEGYVPGPEAYAVMDALAASVAKTVGSK